MTKTLARRALSSAAALATVATLAGCGTNNNSTTTADQTGSPSPTASVACASGSISGAGSTFVQALAQQWIKDFGNTCSGATINYQGVGSGAGVTQFLAGTVDFAGSDSVMKPEELAQATAKGGAVAQIPWASGGVAVMVHVGSAHDIKLSGETLAGIYAGKITSWDDPKITADNGTALPKEGIQVVHRSDGSGTTKVFTSYLTAVAPTTWTAGTGKTVAWPAGQGAKGSDGVTTAVKQTEGAIGYAELSFAQAATLDVAKIKNAAGQFVSPSPDAVSAAIAEATVPADLQVKVTYAPKAATAYPISTVTWVILYTHTKDAAKATLLKDFILYAVGQGQQAATGLSYAPLPSDLITKSTAAATALAG